LKLPSNNQALLTQNSIPATLLKMTMSMMIGFAAGAAFSITDAYFVSRLGTNALAAMGFTFPVTMVIFGISIGIGVGSGSVISRTIGLGNSHEVKRLTVDSLLLALLLVGLFVTLGLLTIEPLFRAIGATGETLSLVCDYMHIWYIGTIFLVVPIVGNNAIRATGDTLSPSVIMVIDIGLNIILDPILIFGLGPFPAMGIKGAALATVLCRALALLASLYILGKRKKMLTSEIPSLKHLCESWKRILHVGIPASLGQLLMPLSAAVIIRMVSNFGTEAVAAFSAGVSIERFVIIPIIALSASLLPIIGQNWGAGNVTRVKKAYKIANIFTIIWGPLSVIIITIANPWLVKLFTDEPSVQKYLSIFLYVIPVAYTFRGLCHNAYSSMNAINHPYHSMVNILFRLFVFTIPFAALGAKTYKFKGLLIGMVIAEVISSFIAVNWTTKLFNETKFSWFKVRDFLRDRQAIPVGPDTPIDGLKSVLPRSNNKND